MKQGFLICCWITLLQLRYCNCSIFLPILSFYNLSIAYTIACEALSFHSHTIFHHTSHGLYSSWWDFIFIFLKALSSHSKAWAIWCLKLLLILASFGDIFHQFWGFFYINKEDISHQQISESKGFILHQIDALHQWGNSTLKLHPLLQSLCYIGN